MTMNKVQSVKYFVYFTFILLIFRVSVIFLRLLRFQEISFAGQLFHSSCSAPKILTSGSLQAVHFLILVTSVI